MATHSSVLWRDVGVEAWQATVHGVIKSQTKLSDSLTHTHTPLLKALIKKKKIRTLSDELVHRSIFKTNRSLIMRSIRGLTLKD